MNLVELRKFTLKGELNRLGEQIHSIVCSLFDTTKQVSHRLIRWKENVLDIYCKSYKKNDSRFYNETRVMNLVQTKIVKHSPNFINFLTYEKCGKQSIIITQNPGYNFKVVKMNDFITDSYSRIDKLSVIFQIVYSLYILALYKINHNDLHLNNILIVEYDRPYDLYFSVREQGFFLNTCFIPFIFDWDLSFSPKTGENQFLDSRKMCDFYGLCNKFIPGRDLYRVFCHTNFDVKDNIETEKLFPGMKVIYEEDSKYLCIPKKSYRFITPKEFLFSKIFDRFKTNKTRSILNINPLLYFSDGWREIQLSIIKEIWKKEDFSRWKYLSRISRNLLFKNLIRIRKFGNFSKRKILEKTEKILKILRHKI